MSRPQTPLERNGPRPFSHGNGISPRGSFVNVAEAAEPGSPLMRDEKERARAEQEVREALLKKEKEDKESAAPAESNVPPIVAYCLASISMVLLNKWVLSGTHFDMTFLLLTIQSAVCVACVVVAKRFGLVSFRDWDSKDARAWFPVSALLVTVIYSGAKALQFLSIPVFTIFKNLTIILIAYGEVMWFGGRVTGLTLVSFALMVGSSVIAGWSDVATSIAKMSTEAQAVLDSVSGLEVPLEGVKGGVGAFNPGYFWMATNCLASAAYVLFMRKRIKLTGFNDWTSMVYNNLLSLPVLLGGSLLLEDWSSASLERNFPAEGRMLLLAGIAVSGAAAVGISFTTAWCVRVTGSTTYSMVGALNKLPVAASGILFFGDPANIGNVSAICVGGVAGVVYSVAKINQGKMDRAKAARDGAKA